MLCPVNDSAAKQLSLPAKLDVGPARHPAAGERCVVPTSLYPTSGHSNLHDPPRPFKHPRRFNQRLINRGALHLLIKTALGGQFAKAVGPQNCFLQGLREHVFVEREVGEELFQWVFTSSNRRKRRSSLTPRWAYFFFLGARLLIRDPELQTAVAEVGAALVSRVS